MFGSRRRSLRLGNSPSLPFAYSSGEQAPSGGNGKRVTRERNVRAKQVGVAGEAYRRRVFGKKRNHRRVLRKDQRAQPLDASDSRRANQAHEQRLADAHSLKRIDDGEGDLRRGRLFLQTDEAG